MRDHELVEKAAQIAITAHAGQFRKGGDSVLYATHPVAVALMLARHGFSDVVCVHNKISTALEVGEDIPERANVLITETFDAGLLGEKAVVVGLDGVPYTLLKDYMDMGIMPELAELCDKGSLLKMSTTLPEISSVAWSSFITGKNPGVTARSIIVATRSALRYLEKSEE